MERYDQLCRLYDEFDTGTLRDHQRFVDILAPMDSRVALGHWDEASEELEAQRDAIREAFSAVDETSRAWPPTPPAKGRSPRSTSTAGTAAGRTYSCWTSTRRSLWPGTRTTIPAGDAPPPHRVPRIGSGRVHPQARWDTE